MPEAFVKKKAQQKAYRESEQGKLNSRTRYEKRGNSPSDIARIQAWKKEKRKDPKWRARENATQVAYINRPEVKAKRRAYISKYRKTTNARLAANIRRRISDVMRGKIKTSNTMNMLGCNILQFMEHLQKHFERGMSFNNYGHFWCVDHVIPLARFDLSKPDHQRLAFHYTNCRPCWNDENLAKNDKLDQSLVTKHELQEALEALK